MTTDGAITGVWSPGVRRLTAGLALTVTVVAFESLSVATILPVVSRHLGDLAIVAVLEDLVDERVNLIDGDDSGPGQRQDLR